MRKGASPKFVWNALPYVMIRYTVLGAFYPNDESRP